MKIPDPLYPCAFEACAAEVSYPADMLHWSNDQRDGSAKSAC